MLSQSPLLSVVATPLADAMLFGVVSLSREGMEHVIPLAVTLAVWTKSADGFSVSERWVAEVYVILGRAFSERCHATPIYNQHWESPHS